MGLTKESFLMFLACLMMCKGVNARCDDTHHECDNGSKCVLLHWVCDGEYDCEDKSDEEECETHCTEDEFACNSSPNDCVAKDWKCDGERDCDDSSDEADCASIVCRPGRFLCGPNATCIQDWLVCDGHQDCPSGLDESTAACLNKTSCTADEFQCVSDKRCISKRWLCDKDADCMDRSDEANCSAVTCASTDWQCGDGQCIPAKWHCDGSYDCRDESDELGCPVLPDDVSSRHCGETEFYCRKSRECIHHEWICDADVDCSDGTDEDKRLCGAVTCLPNHFQCNTSGNCIPEHLTCDGKDHCDDRSDENEALCGQEVMQPCNPETEFDCSGGYRDHCIPNDAVCDGKVDCRGGEDENRTYCHASQNATASSGCAKGNGGCSDNCIATRFGYYCSCPDGYHLAGDNKVCEDIDECLEPDICSQVCHNRPGGFKCSCHPGYELDLSDHVTCRAIGGEPVMIFSNKQDLRKIYLYTGRYRPLLEDVGSAVAVDYDIEGRTLFWSDVTLENISRVTFDENGILLQKEAIASEDTIVGLAYDWIHKNLYWTDTSKDRIEVLSLKKDRIRKILISAELDEPRAIIVDPREKHRLMYWTDWGKQPKIERAFLDGSSRQTLITSGIEWPNGLTIDFETDRLFWVDAKLHIIASSDLVGGDRRIVLTSYSFLKHPFAVAVFEDDVYWSDWHTHSILKTSKHTKPNADVVHIANDLIYPMDLHIYHHLKQPSGEDVCLDMCSHMCLPRVENPGFTCHCPSATKDAEYVLDVDGRTCILKRANNDGSKIPFDITTTPKSNSHVKLDKVEKIQSAQKTFVTVAVAVTVVVAAIVLIILAGCLLVRMHRRKNIKTMNFDNPVYRKTTEEQFCLDKPMQETRTLPLLLEPLRTSTREVV